MHFVVNEVVKLINETFAKKVLITYFFFCK